MEKARSIELSIITYPFTSTSGFSFSTSWSRHSLTQHNQRNKNDLLQKTHAHIADLILHGSSANEIKNYGIIIMT